MKKGFTLVELIVVIAIIGILASITLVSLTSSQDTAADAKVKTELGQLRSTALLSFTNNSNVYTNVCQETAVETILGDTFAETGSGNVIGEGVVPALVNDSYCYDTASSWIIAKELSSGNIWWCIDSTGHSGTVIAGGSNAANFDANVGVCVDINP